MMNPSELEACPVCRLVTTPATHAADCPHCGHTRSQRPPQDVRTAAALGLAATVMLVPAYWLPVMSLDQIGHPHADTIFSGVAKLWRGGMWGLAIIVFTASLLVPLLKLGGLGLLIAAARWPRLGSARALGRLHHVLHSIGRWSMLDIFLVAFLCGIVRFDGLASVEARPGALAFASVVILTLLATSAYDRRLLWRRRA